MGVFRKAAGQRRHDCPDGQAQHTQHERCPLHGVCQLCHRHGDGVHRKEYAHGVCRDRAHHRAHVRVARALGLRHSALAHGRARALQGGGRDACRMRAHTHRRNGALFRHRRAPRARRGETRRRHPRGQHNHRRHRPLCRPARSIRPFVLPGAGARGAGGNRRRYPVCAKARPQAHRRQGQDPAQTAHNTARPRLPHDRGLRRGIVLCRRRGNLPGARAVSGVVVPVARAHDALHNARGMLRLRQDARHGARLHRGALRRLFPGGIPHGNRARTAHRVRLHRHHAHRLRHRPLIVVERALRVGLSRLPRGRRPRVCNRAHRRRHGTGRRHRGVGFQHLLLLPLP